MKMRIVPALLAVLALTACESRYNPGNWNWGGGSTATTLAPQGGYGDRSDQRPLVEQVVSVSVENVPGGAIVTAVGLPPTVGYWNVDLVPVHESVTGKPVGQDGVMWLEYVAVGPLSQQPAVTQAAREVIAGIHLSDQALRGVGQVVVVGQNNQRSARR